MQKRVSITFYLRRGQIYSYHLGMIVDSRMCCRTGLFLPLLPTMLLVAGIALDLLFIPMVCRVLKRSLQR